MNKMKNNLADNDKNNNNIIENIKSSFLSNLN